MIDSRSKFGLPVRSWLTREDALVGLLLSSFVINLLGLVFPVCVLQFYDRIIPNKSNSTLVAMVCIILAALALEALLKVLRAYVSSWSSARFTYNMGRLLFNRLLYADLGQFERNTAGLYVDKFNSAESIREYYCGQNLIMLVDVPFIFIYIILMFCICPYMAVVPILIIVYMVMESLLASEKAYKNLESKTNMSEVKSRFLYEVLSGIHTIKALGMEEQFLRRYERLHQREINSNYELIQRMSQSNRSGALYSQLGVILTVSMGGILVINHYLSVGGLAACILIVGKLMLPVTKLVVYLEKNKQIGIAKSDLAFIENIEPEYKPDAPVVDYIAGEIDMQNLSFKYPESEEYIFQDINLHINPNEFIVLHGASFAGKSTLLQLMAGLYKPSSGVITVDGLNLCDINIDSYRCNIAYMPDAGELFSGTILENITIFETERYAERAKQLAKELGIHNFIEALPQSYNTQIGTGTVDLLSKGHKQVLLIIRTLLNDPHLIIFDEANLALDIESDVRLRKFLLSKKGKCTLVLVTHRPSIMQMADKHYKLENGKLTEFGWT